MKRLFLTAALVASCASIAAANDIVVKANKIVTMNASDQVIDNGVIVIDGKTGRIKAMGEQGDIALPKGATVHDLGQRWLVPGLIDCHDHVAGSLRDLNDGVWLTNPGLRTVDALDPKNDNLKNALAGGVTTVLLIPGSGTNMSGFGTVSKTAGETVKEMTMRAPGSLKIAQAGNPERYWFGVGRSYMNYNLRQTLEKAQTYNERWKAWEKNRQGKKPEKSLVWEGFRGLFEQVFPVSVHTQMYQVVHKTLVMLHDKFKLRVVLDHSTFDGYKTAALIKERPSVYTIVGPRQYFFDRTERRIIGCAQRYYQQGIRKLGINTDAPVVPQEELTLQATIGARLGLDPYVALKGLTIMPARALGVDKLVGSLEVGKVADIGVWTGDPIDPRHACLKTFVNGKLVYDAKKKRRF